MDTFTRLWYAINKFTKMKDSIMVSLVSGLLGTMAMDLSNVLLWRTKKAELLHGHLAGSMFMRAFRTNQTKNFVLGQIFHMLTGTTLGIPIFHLLKRTGKDHYLIKGAFAGLAAWGVLYNFGQRVGLFMAKPHLTKTHYSALWHNLLYGVTTAQAIVSFSDPSLFPQHKQLAQIDRASKTQATSHRTNKPRQQEPTEEPLGVYH